MSRWSSLKLFTRSIICPLPWFYFFLFDTCNNFVSSLYLHISIILFILVSLYTLEVWIFLGFNVNFKWMNFLENLVARGSYCCGKRRQWYYDQHQMSKVFLDTWKDDGKTIWFQRVFFITSFIVLDTLVGSSLCLFEDSGKIKEANDAKFVHACVTMCQFYPFLGFLAFVCVCAHLFWGVFLLSILYVYTFFWVFLLSLYVSISNIWIVQNSKSNQDENSKRLNKIWAQSQSTSQHFRCKINEDH